MLILALLTLNLLLIVCALTCPSLGFETTIISVLCKNVHGTRSNPSFLEWSCWRPSIDSCTYYGFEPRPSQSHNDLAFQWQPRPYNVQEHTDNCHFDALEICLNRYKFEQLRDEEVFVTSPLFCGIEHIAYG